MCEAELKAAVDKLTENQEGLSKAIMKAKTFELIVGTIFFRISFSAKI